MANKVVEIRVKNDSGDYDNLIVSKADLAEYASEDRSKGTIDERLNKLKQTSDYLSQLRYSEFIDSVIVWSYKHIDSYLESDIGVTFLTDDEGYFMEPNRFASEEKIFLGYVPTGYEPRSISYGVLKLDITYSIPLEGVGDVEINDKLPINISIEPNGGIYIYPKSTMFGSLYRLAYVINSAECVIAYKKIREV